MITIDEAIAICEGLVGDHPRLQETIDRIKQLRDERDMFYRLAKRCAHDAAWERSDMKKWADKQRDDPDND